MAFRETPRFPDDISYGVDFGPEFNTIIAINASGDEARNSNWSQARSKGNASHGIRTPAQSLALISFFRVMMGKLHGWRFKDWADFSDGGAGVVALISGSTYQMYKRYTSGSSTYDRKIQKPVSGSTVVAGGGSYTVDSTTGIITKNSGAVPTGWTGDFDVPCRFDTDQMQMESVTRTGGVLLTSWKSIPIIEIRL